MTRPATQDRIDFAARRLLEGRSASAVVAELSEARGISRRSARRYVAAAFQVLQADLEETGIERPQLVAQLVHLLMEAAAQGLRNEHPSATVGAVRALSDLLHLTHSPK